MSRVAYLLGAGASYGERAVDDNGNKRFVRGLPILSEMEEAIETLIPRTLNGHIDTSVNAARVLGVDDANKLTNLVRILTHLKEMCASYPTIDTLARQLYVTREPYTTRDNNLISYDDLKRFLTLVLLMMQSHNNRDLRYDGFIASIISDKRQFPPMTILSWNYDAQFELAYSGYSSDRYIPHMWQELNVLNKMYLTEFDAKKPFAMVKLNGTAFFSDITHPVRVKGREIAGLRDCFFGLAIPRKCYQYGADYASAGSFLHTTLSYVWESEKEGDFRQLILQRVYDTETLIVIGYSFPYVNREMDGFILSHMPGLRKVIIQDPNYEEIKERVEMMIPDKPISVEYEHKNDKQFYIPKEF